MSKPSFYEKVSESFTNIGMAATYTGLNEDGAVVCRALESEELSQLIKLYDNIKDIPSEYTIYDKEGNKLTT